MGSFYAIKAGCQYAYHTVAQLFLPFLADWHNLCHISYCADEVKIEVQFLCYISYWMKHIVYLSGTIRLRGLTYTV